MNYKYLHKHIFKQTYKKIFNFTFSIAFRSQSMLQCTKQFSVTVQLYIMQETISYVHETKNFCYLIIHIVLLLEFI